MRRLFLLLVVSLFGLTVCSCGGGSSNSPSPTNPGTYAGVIRGTDAQGNLQPGIVNFTIDGRSQVNMSAIDNKGQIASLDGNASPSGGTLSVASVGNLVTFTGEFNGSSVSGRWVNNANGSSGFWTASKDASNTRLVASSFPVVQILDPSKLKPLGISLDPGGFTISTSPDNITDALRQATDSAPDQSRYSKVYVYYSNGSAGSKDKIMYIAPSGIGADGRLLDKLIMFSLRTGYYLISPTPTTNSYSPLFSSGFNANCQVSQFADNCSP